MNRVVIHIGTHKTGTTAFQQLMSKNVRLLRKNGIAYDWIELSANKHCVVYEDVGGAAATQKSRDKLLKKLKDAVSQNKTVLISEEGLSEPNADIPQTLARIQDFAEVHIVCCIRPQFELLEKLWAQRLREHATRLGLEEFVVTRNSEDRCKYFELLDRWKSCFGHGSLIVLNYDDISHDSAGELAKACALNVKLPSEKQRENWTPSAHAMRLIEALNRSGAEFRVDDVISASQNVAQRENLSLMPYEMACRISDRYKIENRKLRERFGIELRKPVERDHVSALSLPEIFEFYFEGVLEKETRITERTILRAKKMVVKLDVKTKLLLKRLGVLT